MCYQKVWEWVKTRLIKGPVDRKRADAAMVVPDTAWLVEYKQGVAHPFAGALAVPDAFLAEVRASLVDRYFADWLAARIDGLLNNFWRAAKRFLLERCPQLFIWSVFVVWSIGVLLLGDRASQPDFVVMLITGGLWGLRLCLFSVPVVFCLHLFDIANILESRTNAPRWFSTGLPSSSFESSFDNEFNQLLIQRLMDAGMISSDTPASVIGLSHFND